MGRCLFCGREYRGGGIVATAGGSYCSQACKLQKQVLERQRDRSEYDCHANTGTRGESQKGGCGSTLGGLVVLCLLAAVFNGGKRDSAESGEARTPAKPALTPSSGSQPKDPAPTDQGALPRHETTTIAESSSPKSGVTTEQRPKSLPADYLEIQSTDGRVIWAKFLAETKTSVLVRRYDGAEFEIPLDRISEASRERIRHFREAKHLR
jgi:hypothetical protein